MNIKVNDMSCKHCVAKIEKQLILDGIDAEVDLASKSVIVDEDVVNEAKESIKKAGYHPEI